MKNFTVMLLIFGICMLWATSQAEALSCVPPPPVKEELDNSTVVFKGKAIETQEDGLTLFQIHEVWKGVEILQLEIYDNGWDPFIKDTEYLVFGSVYDDVLRMNLCGRTGPWDEERKSAMDASGLQSIQLELLIEEEQTTQNSGYTLPTILAVSVVVLLVLFLIRSKRKR